MSFFFLLIIISAFQWKLLCDIMIPSSFSPALSYPRQCFRSNLVPLTIAFVMETGKLLSGSVKHSILISQCYTHDVVIISRVGPLYHL
jgi:hypothetical protein